MTLPGNQSSPKQVNSTSTTLDAKSGSPNGSPQTSPRTSSKNQHHKRDASVSSAKELIPEVQEKNENNKGSGGELSRSNSQEPVRERKSSDKVRKKAPWYTALYPTYKSRSDDFKRIFKDIPSDERLVVDYSCAIQKDILVHGRLYVSQNYLCFYANIFRWETQVTLKWKEVTGLTKERTALVIPNAILVHTASDRHFLTSFAARDKAYLMLFRVWQNALMDQPMSTQELWQWVHSCYGDELGLTSDDDDYVSPGNPELAPGPGGLPDEEKAAPDLIPDTGTPPVLDGSVLVPGDQPPSNGPFPPPTPSDVNPSDQSDSSPSESESEKQGSLVKCPVAHEGKLMLHMQVAIHVDQLFTHLFTNSKFFFDLHETRKTTDMKQSPWVTNPSTNQKGRTVSLTLQLAPAIGPKQAKVTESQKMLSCSAPGEMYAIEIEASNAGVPYADSFFVLSHYCLTRGADPGTSTIAVYCQIKYRKNVWGLVKSFIEKNIWSGMEEYFATLVKALEAECERTRRAMASGMVSGKQKMGGGRRRGVSKPLPLPTSEAEEETLLQPIVLPQAPTSADSLPWVVFLVLFLLLVFNAALYYKLWGLEQAERYFDPTKEAFLELRGTPQTPEEWRRLVVKQEQLHSAEVGRWLQVIKASIHLLAQVEHSLTRLQVSLQNMMNVTSSTRDDTSSGHSVEL